MYVAWLATVEQRCGEPWGRNRAAEFRIGGCYRGQPGPQEAGVSVCEPKVPGATVMPCLRSCVSSGFHGHGRLLPGGLVARACGPGPPPRASAVILTYLLPAQLQRYRGHAHALAVCACARARAGHYSSRLSL